MNPRLSPELQFTAHALHISVAMPDLTDIVDEMARDIIREELREHIRQQIRNELNSPQWQEKYRGDGFDASDAVVEMMRTRGNEIFSHMLAGFVQQAVQNLRYSGM